MLRFYSPAALPTDEPSRQAAVEAVRLCSITDDPVLHGLVEQAARSFGAPMAAVSIIDRERQFFAAGVNLPVRETSRSSAFCSHTIFEAEGLWVPDAQEDPRFAGNPLVVADPFIRFYAGAPLRNREGQALGALCILDTAPRSGFERNARDRLRRLAGKVMSRIEERQLQD